MKAGLCRWITIPMLSKLIGYAPTREMAIARLLRALEEYFVGGIKTNVDLFRGY